MGETIMPAKLRYSSKKYNFDYEVSQPDIENGTVVVRWVPENANLTPLSYNCNLIIRDYTDITNANNEPIYADNSSVPFSAHLNYTVRVNAPHDIWERQEMMLNNNAAVTSSNGTITDPDNVEI
jgi:hypothetical protein